MKFLRNAHVSPSPYVIGICGCSRNVGTTTVSLTLANYLCNKNRESTAYIELNPTDAIVHLSGNPNRRKPFIHRGIHFYPAYTIQRLSEPLHASFRWIIIDFGILTRYTLPEYLRCNRRLMVGNSSPWNPSAFAEYIEHFLSISNQKSDDMVFIGNSRIKELTPYSLETIPFLPDPFHLTSEYFEFCEKMLRRN